MRTAGGLGRFWVVKESGLRFPGTIVLIKEGTIVRGQESVTGVACDTPYGVVPVGGCPRLLGTSPLLVY